MAAALDSLWPLRGGEAAPSERRYPNWAGCRTYGSIIARESKDHEEPAQTSKPRSGRCLSREEIRIISACCSLVCCQIQWHEFSWLVYLTMCRLSRLITVNMLPLLSKDKSIAKIYPRCKQKFQGQNKLEICIKSECFCLRTRTLVEFSLSFSCFSLECNKLLSCIGKWVLTLKMQVNQDLSPGLHLTVPWVCAGPVGWGC